MCYIPLNSNFQDVLRPQENDYYQVAHFICFNDYAL